MDEKEKFDFWYAVNNTEVVVRPKRRLESFGTTAIHYFLATEIMDAVDCVRVREGRIHAYKPEILTPDGFGESMLEGFTEEQSEDYLEWLRENQGSLMILKYGFRVRKEDFRTETVNDRIDQVVDRITEELRVRDLPMSALVRGVDEPWEVCLLKLMVEMVQQSAAANARELQQDPNGAHNEIERAFTAARKDPEKIQALADLLRRRSLFAQYEDRFFSLVRSQRR